MTYANLYVIFCYFMQPLCIFTAFQLRFESSQTCVQTFLKTVGSLLCKQTCDTYFHLLVCVGLRLDHTHADLYFVVSRQMTLKTIHLLLNKLFEFLSHLEIYGINGQIHSTKF